jgi:hypothetical protein
MAFFGKFDRPCKSISTRPGRKHQTPTFSSTRGAIPLAEKLRTQILLVSCVGTKMSSPPLKNFLGSFFLAKGAPAAKTDVFLQAERL